MMVRRVGLGAALWAVAATLIVIVVVADVPSPGVVHPVMITAAVFAIVFGVQVVRRGAPGHADARRAMATAHGTGRTVWRRVGAAAVAIAGAALTTLCVIAWLVKAEVIGIENSNDPHWLLLIFLTFGSVALLGSGVLDLLKHRPAARDGRVAGSKSPTAPRPRVSRL